MAHSRPVIDQRAAEKMNLNVLRRIDPEIEELLATAGHVALYDFDIPTKRWSRKDVEGSLFLVKRRSQPRFQFIILNKKSAVATDNFVEDVHGGFQCEVQKPYVLYRNRANEVVGIWFYEDADCDRISALLQRIASTFAAPSEAEAGVGAQPTPAEDDSAAAAGGNSESSGAGDDAFWDRRVVVPEEVGSSNVLQRHQQEPAAVGVAAAAPVQQQPLQANGLPSLLAPVQRQQAAQAQPAAADATATAPGGATNDLARLFAGIRVGGTAAAAPVAPVAAPAAAAAPPAVGPMQLLTPQLLQQEAAAAVAAAPAPAAAAPAEQAPEAAAGSMLLQSLLRGSAAQPPAAAAAAPAPALPRPVDITEAADRALRSKVSTLLSSLASNEAFCGILATELKRAGLV